MSVEKCKELLDEVAKLCAQTSRLTRQATPQPPAVTNRNTPSVSSATDSLTSGALGFQEHRRLFGFNPTACQTTSKRRKRENGGTSKKVKRPTWTRTFVCLGNTGEERMPTPKEYRELKAADLGEKRLTFFADSTSIDFDNKLKDAYPKLETAGGYTLLCGSHTRQLEVINPPYNIPRLKEHFVGQGKLFIRPLQKDLDISPTGNSQEDEEEDDLVEVCMKCNKLFYLSELADHVENCSNEHGKNSPEEDPTMYVETPSSPQVLVPGILRTECLMYPTDANVNVSQSSESTSITPPAIVNNALTCNDDQAADEELERDSVTHEPTCSISNNIEVVQAVTPRCASVDEAVQETVQLCQQSNVINNPVEVLRVLQSRMVTGRQLDISDPSQTVEGETNQIFVDRFNLQETGFDEIAGLEDKRLTLEVQFYNERAVDLGGPRKEFFLLILRDIKEKLFDDGIKENQEKYYHTVGVIFALSMLQNGKLPRFLQEELLQEIFMDVNPSPCMLAIRKGLSELGVYQVVKEIPLLLHLFRKVEKGTLTLKQLTALLEPDFSEEGTNSRKFEGEVYSIFIKYLREVASGRRGDLTLEHILQFTTGVDEEPVLGFSLHPQIVFAGVFGGNFLPRANTCTNCLTIPRGTLTTPLLQVQELHNLYDYAFASAFFGMI